MIYFIQYNYFAPVYVQGTDVGAPRFTTASAAIVGEKVYGLSPFEWSYWEA